MFDRPIGRGATSYRARAQSVPPYGMTIEWFPGHMAAARKKAAEMMGKIDVVIEVLDARLPGASSNPLIERLRHDRQRPCLKILNKADLADPDASAAWV